MSPILLEECSLPLTDACGQVSQMVCASRCQGLSYAQVFRDTRERWFVLHLVATVVTFVLSSSRRFEVFGRQRPAKFGYFAATKGNRGMRVLKSAGLTMRWEHA